MEFTQKSGIRVQIYPYICYLLISLRFSPQDSLHLLQVGHTFSAITQTLAKFWTAGATRTTKPYDSRQSLETDEIRLQSVIYPIRRFLEVQKL